MMTSIDRWRWIHAFQFQIVNVLAEDEPKKICFSFHLKNVYVMHVRIFVGAWNVVGRSPVGSLAVDVSDWLNLKDAADMFQEILPLKTINVIGVEDPTEATNWNCTPEINTSSIVCGTQQ
ncbi:hypothetical protein OIU77_001910 [Salix suchowensis]|uniref:Uncharacterized protein n=1 Tax=Salix suchowensis TaxID=1278906 RepID=A0ABQ9B324_9ROSI|nr:hypothetical protein OIU77_001910 [Salix suchowensis]